MTKAVRMMEENACLCDVLVYVVDSRAVLASINPILDRITSGKRVVYAFNKCDLVESSQLNDWVKEFAAQGKKAIKTCGTNSDCKDIIAAIKECYKDVLDKYSAKGVKKHIRAMICGIPNSGKSTIINSMRKKASAVTGDKAGVTRGKQWLSLDSQIDLLDTPGTLWGKFENQTVAKHLAYLGSISDDILDSAELAIEFLTEAKEKFAKNIAERYGVDTNVEPLELLESIAFKRGFKLRGGDVDYDRTAKTIIDDFRKGRLGKIMLERANENAEAVNNG